MKEFEFTRYVVPLRDRMFRYAQSLLLCADEAEDVTHDLLERLWTERGRLDGCRDIASFVMAAVRNRCYDCLRRRRADGPQQCCGRMGGACDDGGCRRVGSA